MLYEQVHKRNDILPLKNKRPSRLLACLVVCVLAEMPCDLAVLDMNAAEGIAGLYPAVARWYIGGHSLGGCMAAYYAAAHPEELQGLVLLGAYSSAELSGTALRVLSVYGSEDQVMNRCLRGGSPHRLGHGGYAL